MTPTGVPVRTRVRTAAVVGFAVVVGVLAGIGVGYHYAARYYDQVTGDWHVGLHAAGIGVAHGAPVALGIAFGLTIVGLLLREVLPSAIAALSSAAGVMSSPMRLRRYVLTVTVRLLVLGGALAGVGAGYAYYSVNHEAALAVVVGFLGALGAWVVAALIGLFVEIANSLRTLANAVTPAGPGN